MLKKNEETKISKKNSDDYIRLNDINGIDMFLL